MDENDYTVYSYDDLLFELDELQHNVRSRKSFIENQVEFLLFHFFRGTTQLIHMSDVLLDYRSIVHECNARAAGGV